MSPVRLALLFVGFMTAHTATATAGDLPPAECPSTGVRLRPARLGDVRPEGETPAPTTIRADVIEAFSPTVGEFRGAVELARGTQHVNADQLRYDRVLDRVDARGNVRLSEDSHQFQGQALELDLSTRIGSATGISYTLAGGLGRGDARAVLFQGPDRTRLLDVRYTACPAGNDDWFLNIGRLDLDTEDDVGTARNATLEFMGVPFFYAPYISFPISDRRKSGFLFPQVGHSDRLGATFAAPYYLNLAPNYDAIVTPHIHTRRGILLENELRYLGRTLRGETQVEYLPHDDLTGDHRAAVAWHHQQTLNPWWSARVDARAVSDLDYFGDFGADLDATSRTHLPRFAELGYHGAAWDFIARAANYQTIDRSVDPLNRPYARLPQLLLVARPNMDGAIRYRVETEWVNFQRDAGVTGTRLNVAPALSLPFTRPYGFLVPEISVRHVRYELNDSASTSLTVPLASLDGGLTFEREMTLGTADYIQTLEPRLFYVYVPERRQDALPLFDTGLPDFSFANLFRANRFVGGDRVGDANQVTLAVTTRFLAYATGAEQARASIGWIRYFDDREVNIPAGRTMQSTSDLAAEALAEIGPHWHASAAIQWDRAADAAIRSNLVLRYQPERDRVVNLGYRLQRDQFEQTDVSAEWPVGGGFVLRARSLYSLTDNRNIDAYAGFEYRACCWVVRAHVFRRLIQTTAQSLAFAEEDRGFMLEFELSGLGKLGAAPASPLKQNLFGYSGP